MRTIHNEAAVNIFELAHDHDRRAWHVDRNSSDLILRSIIKQTVVNVFLLQNIYSVGV